MTARARFTQADVSRVLRAANDADVQVRIEIELDGKMVILPGVSAAAAANPWDDDDDKP